MAKRQGARSVVISAAIEAEIAQLGEDEVGEYIGAMGLDEPGLDRLIREGYALLDLITYFTVGPKETRAWTVKRGAKAPQAAGVIHTDFEKGFIRAQTIAYDDFVGLGGEVAAKEAGKPRRRQGIRRPGRRHHAVQVQRLTRASRRADVQAAANPALRRLRLRGGLGERRDRRVAERTPVPAGGPSPRRAPCRRR